MFPDSQHAVNDEARGKVGTDRKRKRRMQDEQAEREQFIGGSAPKAGGAQSTNREIVKEVRAAIDMLRQDGYNSIQDRIDRLEKVIPVLFKRGQVLSEWSAPDPRSVQTSKKRRPAGQGAKS